MDKVKKTLKETAQDLLIHGMADTISKMSEHPYKENPEVIFMAKEQAKRVLKLFGYAYWPGITD